MDRIAQVNVILNRWKVTQYAWSWKAVVAQISSLVRVKIIGYCPCDKILQPAATVAATATRVCKLGMFAINTATEFVCLWYAIDGHECMVTTDIRFIGRLPCSLITQWNSCFSFDGKILFPSNNRGEFPTRCWATKGCVIEFLENRVGRLHSHNSLASMREG